MYIYICTHTYTHTYKLSLSHTHTQTHTTEREEKDARQKRAAHLLLSLCLQFNQLADQALLHSRTLVIGEEEGEGAGLGGWLEVVEAFGFMCLCKPCPQLRVCVCLDCSCAISILDCLWICVFILIGYCIFLRYFFGVIVCLC